MAGSGEVNVNILKPVAAVGTVDSFIYPLFRESGWLQP